MFVVVGRPAPVALLPEQLVGGRAGRPELRDALFDGIARTSIADAVNHREHIGRAGPCKQHATRSYTPTENTAHKEGEKIMDDRDALLLSRCRRTCHTNFEDNGTGAGGQLHVRHIEQ